MALAEEGLDAEAVKIYECGNQDAFVTSREEAGEESYS